MNIKRQLKKAAKEYVRDFEEHLMYGDGPAVIRHIKATLKTQEIMYPRGVVVGLCRLLARIFNHKITQSGRVVKTCAFPFGGTFCKGSILKKRKR